MEEEFCHRWKTSGFLMHLWFDLSTPKEVLFFKGMIREMAQRGHKVIITTRKYTETNDLIRYFRLEAKEIGTHGKTRTEKLWCSIDRLKKLYRFFNDKPIDAVITLSNPEACRIAFGLGFPIFNFIDIPEAETVCRLTLPLSSQVFIPFHVPREAIRRYWTGEPFVYDCFDVSAWMPKNPAPLSQLDLPEKIVKRIPTQRLIIYREAEVKASYFQALGKQDLTLDIIKNLKKKYPKIVFLQASRYKKHRVVDMQSLLDYATLFIGGGGTMNLEASYWGTWTISCRPFLTSYDEWLQNNRSQIHVDTVEDGVQVASEMLDRADKNPCSAIIRKMQFPLDNICSFIEQF